MVGQLGVKLLFDLDAWILASKMTASQTLAATRGTLRERIKADNTANTSETQGVELVELPVSFRNPRKVRFELCAPTGPLPTTLLPLSQESEQLIVHQLISELNTLHCLNLGKKPELKRSVCLPTCEHGLSRLVFVGASHTGKMATLLGLSDQVLYLPLPAQTAPKSSVDCIVEKQDALIIDIFSSSILMGSTEMGMPVSAIQPEPGRYHISGCLSASRSLRRAS